jgi:Mn-dependent DtxR family transcriptional regulator
MTLPTTSFDPVTSRLMLVLTRIQRETRHGVRPPITFSTLCTALGVPSEIRARLLRRLVSEGYVTEEGGGQVTITDEGALLVRSSRW